MNIVIAMDLGLTSVAGIMSTRYVYLAHLILLNGYADAAQVL